jgi:hypothetical protein
MRMIGGTICVAMFFAAAISAAVTARANPVVYLGHYYVVKDVSAPAEILVSDSGNATSEDIEQMQFTLQLGTGTLNTPSIGSVDFLSGTIWSGHVSAANVYPSAGASPQFKPSLLFTDNLGDFVNANGRLATATFSATGAAAGDYPIKLTGTIDPGANSKFYNGKGAVVPATFADGTLTVVIRGDYDRDNQLTAGDISAALGALSNLNSYEAMKGLNDAGLSAVGDVDVSGAVDNRDLQSLLISLANAGGGGGLSVVPEPAAWVLALGALVSLSIIEAAIGFRHGRCTS